MKKTILFLAVIVVFTVSCNKAVESNIKMYTTTWDEVINEGKLDLINSTNFDENITLIISPENIVGIENVKSYYSNYLTGFSNIDFSIVDIFGQGDKLVKHWQFKGTHTGEFFGIPATQKSVTVQGTTLIKMKNGKIFQEQDFMDNMSFMQQLGIVSNPENINIINGAYEAFSKGDIPSVIALLDDNVIWNEAEGNSLADGNPYIGPKAVSDGIFNRIGASYEYFNLDNIKLHEMSNNQVLATLRYKAKLKKNAALIDAQVAHHWTLNNGKIIGFQQYTDTKQLAEANNK